MPILTLSDRETVAQAVARHPRCLVYFTAAWCGPCQDIAPEIEARAKADPTLCVLKVDVDAHGECCEYRGVRSMPTFELVCDGEIRGRVTGADVDALDALLERHAAR